MLLINLTHCIYCGLPATTRDHWIPLARETESNRQDNFEVPCCRPCNATAGAKLFPTFWAKQEYLWKKALERQKTDYELLATYAHIVVKALKRFERGKNSAQTNAASQTGTCEICGGSIQRKKFLRKRNDTWGVIEYHPVALTTCSAECSKHKHHDKRRRKAYAARPWT